MCYFIVLMFSLLFYNVENSKHKEKSLIELSVLKLSTGRKLDVSVELLCSTVSAALD